MLIVDASCLYEVVADGTQAESVRSLLASDTDQVAPHLVDAEVLGLIRRDSARGVLDPTAAHQSVQDLGLWPGERIDHRPFLGRAWELRHTVRSWDALYVAVAEAFNGTLLTRDVRLTGASGPRCRFLRPK
ncbi:MAG: PIN domain-containing protein [Acidimicrobiia bacterium]|nr:PIN domain-containing protein [Acidimicrobiia bacterium]